MRIFLSHSSKDSTIVTDVWERLGPHIAWIDKADIDLGDIIIEKIAAGIEQATDFVLLWSENASKSPWVRIELHMGFLRYVEESGCRLRVVKLDNTPLPLFLRPFLYLDTSSSPQEAPKLITEKLLGERMPRTGTVRRPFVDRHDELKRMELAIDDPGTHAVLLQGLTGIGKRTLAKKCVEGLFSPPDLRTIRIRPGTGWVELTLQLCAMAGMPTPEDGSPLERLQSDARTAVERLLNQGAILAFYEIQNWIEEEGRPSPILTTLLEWFQSIVGLSYRPVLLTGTRIPRLTYEARQYVQTVRVEGIPNEHLSTLIRHWLLIEKGQVDIDQGKLDALSSELCGYPLAARIAASLLAHYGIAHVLAYPREIVELRVDIAKNILAEAKVSNDGVRILQALALVDQPIPSSRIASALALDADTFRDGVDSALSFGLVSTEGLALVIHPIVRDFYWRQVYGSPGYHGMVTALAGECKEYITTLELGSEEYARILPTVFRLVALTGDVEGARQIRRDLMGTLLETAIQLYHRREYEMSLKYTQIVLDESPNEAVARLYRARSLTRLGKQREARGILEELVRERPWSIQVLHALGRLEMQEEHWEDALARFEQALLNRSVHLPSLRDSAECFLRLDDLEKAKEFVDKAKQVDLSNPYVLQIESQILEKSGRLEEAYDVMTLARAQEPHQAAFAHRLGRIAQARDELRIALAHYEECLTLDEHFWEARLSKASVLIDLREMELAAQEIERLKSDVRGRSIHVLRGIEAKYFLAVDEPAKTLQVIKGIRSAAAFGLRAKAYIRISALHQRNGYAKLAEEAILAAKKQVAEGLNLHPGNEELIKLEADLERNP